ncbi:tetratricopeptide repeat protein [Burkholderia sp. Ac-20353]|uniref:tetratricopeptide repeat protein n=1 Tax=Burkholderia sp. Ac-20353 TaxID=2703894 RepID=UPI00197BAE34|nr:tetratricopeptide repeat protein [Burkholderia sp. Ac-20353]MBN3791248.1 tetratricopeptide repeat protein [Burkholderia sp. Ac-20353]
MKSPRGRAPSAATLVATAVMGVALTLLPAAAAHAQKAPSTADGTPEIDTSIAGKQWKQALAQLDARIAANPHDVQAQFKRGTVLVRLNRDDDAIQQFVAITQAYPELPEPYNNLAALYAKHGRYDEARTALVTATQANPSYPLAYENLGDLYLRLAAESYKRAQSLGRTSGATAQRLADLQKIISPPKPAAGTRAAPSTPDYAGRAAANVSTTTLPLSPTFQFGGPSGAMAAPYVAPSH